MFLYLFQQCLDCLNRPDWKEVVAQTIHKAEVFQTQLYNEQVAVRQAAERQAAERQAAERQAADGQAAELQDIVENNLDTECPPDPLLESAEASSFSHSSRVSDPVPGNLERDSQTHHDVELDLQENEGETGMFQSVRQMGYGIYVFFHDMYRYLTFQL